MAYGFLFGVVTSLCQAEGVTVILPDAAELLAPVTGIDGFRLACLIDAATGMVVASIDDQENTVPRAAAGAADIVNVLALMNGGMATEETLEDVMVTFSDSFYLIRPLRRATEPQILLLLILDRLRTNLAMAHRSVRDFCASFAG
jgi:hypothetical protein